MPTPKFIQIVASPSASGHALYGLTADGTVYRYDMLRDQPSKSTSYQSYHHEWVPCIDAEDQTT